MIGTCIKGKIPAEQIRSTFFALNDSPAAWRSYSSRSPWRCYLGCTLIGGNFILLFLNGNVKTPTTTQCAYSANVVTLGHNFFWIPKSALFFLKCIIMVVKRGAHFFLKIWSLFRWQGPSKPPKNRPKQLVNQKIPNQYLWWAHTCNWALFRIGTCQGTPGLMCWNLFPHQELPWGVSRIAQNDPRMP